MSDAKRKLGRVHMDLWGPAPDISLQGNKYMLIITDQNTKQVWTEYKPDKKNVFRNICSWAARAELESGFTVGIIHVDRGREFLNNVMEKWCFARETKLEPTIGYKPESNGIAERCNRSILKKANALRFEAGLGAEYWDEACRAAIYLRNRGPVSKRMMSPHEAWTENKPIVTHYYIWGCPAYVYIPKEKRTKLNHWSWKEIFVGYHSDFMRIYRIWDLVDKLIKLATSVIFDESCDIELTSLRQFEQTTENCNITMSNNSSDSEDEDPLPGHLLPSDEIVKGSNTSSLTELDNNNIEQLVPTKKRLVKIPPPPILRQSTRKRKGTQTTGPLAIDHRKMAKICAFFSKTVYVLTTLEEALQCPNRDMWIDAINVEMDGIFRNKTFKDNLFPEGQQPITAKFVFDVKYREDGTVLKYKARLVARGFTQIYGVDYEETFAPTVKYETLRLLLAVAAKLGWHIHQMDVVAAFLAGKLHERIWLRLPCNILNLLGNSWDYEDTVRLLQSIYGLKQAARVWFLLLTGYLESIGFHAVEGDKSVFTNGKVIIGIYVDDLIILGADLESIKEVKKLLKGRFEMKDEGEARVILGIRIQRLFDGKLAIDQSRYAAGVVQTYLEEDDPSTLIPMEPSAVTHLAETGGALFHDLVVYTQAIGKLLHLCHSRPDIVFAVHKLCQFARCPYQIHWAALRRILQYIKDTITFGICWNGPNLVLDEDNYKHTIESHAGSSKKDDVLAFLDLDYTSNLTDRKSCRGAVFLV